MKASSILGVAAVALGACATTQNQVAVLGDASSLEGAWHGEFQSGSTSRNGSIHFNLQAGRDSAYGDVMMVSNEWTNQGSRYWDNNPRVAQQPTLLYVRFIHVNDVTVRGIMEPYQDAVCNCMVKVVFEGTVAWDVIEGTYQARTTTGALAFEGTWRVKRILLESDASVDGHNTLAYR